MEKEMICIVCPVGCHISVNTETYEVKGNACPRGAVYGKEELTAPVKRGDIVLENIFNTGVNVVVTKDM